jgi:hypothetical protein
MFLFNSLNMMKISIAKSMLTLAILMSTMGCSKYLDVEPKNKIPGEKVLSDPNGVRSFLAELYYQAPVEDHVFFPRAGFNARENTGFLSLAQYGLEAIHSEWPNWNEYANDWWDKGYKLNRNINILLAAIPTLALTEADKKSLTGEAHFLRAYTYFELAKWYGGVPIIAQNADYTNDFEQLKVPRNTEKETWDFVLAECDRAIAGLPEKQASTDESKRRATKWAALALKSRAALYAGSLAKYWRVLPLSGEAASKNLVGMKSADANGYYQQCIEASLELMNSGKFKLYQANPASVEVAIENYQAMFVDPNVATDETIFVKGYATVSNPLAHDLDGWNEPNQVAEGFPYHGRTNPVLELIDQYEHYGSPGEIHPIHTRSDGKEASVEGYKPTVDYLRYDRPDQVFDNLDARFFASIIYPNAVWKGQRIIIQGGIVRGDGSLLDSRGAVDWKGTTYYTYGKEQNTQYSGFDGSANMTRSGFLMRKFMTESAHITNFKQSTTDFIDMRYAEVLLNLAESVVESGYTENNARQLAEDAINAIRFRAGHTVKVGLTLERVLRERTVELAFENKQYWDMIRRRTFHVIFKNKQKEALVPYLDLRGESPKYIFVRRTVPGGVSNNFSDRDYYRPIPGIGGNGVVQNPQY